MWCQILKSFQVNFAFCFEHAYFKRSARVYYKSEKKNLLGFYNQNMTWNAFHVFYILLHATPQTHLEQAVPPCLSVSWSILVGRCESIKWDDCLQFDKHYSALHILIITFSIRELGSVPLIPFHPYTLSICLTWNIITSAITSPARTHNDFSSTCPNSKGLWLPGSIIIASLLLFSTDHVFASNPSPCAHR